MGQTEIVVALFATFGGLGINLLHLVDEHGPVKKRQKKDGEALYLIDPVYYYLHFVFLPLLGGGLALAYQASGTSLTPILAVNIGACAPLIFKTLANGFHGQAESVDRGGHVPTASLTLSPDAQLPHQVQS
jgi:hypothetical protein